MPTACNPASAPAAATRTPTRTPGPRGVPPIGAPGQVTGADMATERMNAHGTTAQDLRGALQLANA